MPKWLGDRMTGLGTVITAAIVLEYGRDELLRRLAHPFWFQSFGTVMGMDWHSSGITTSVIGALKRGLTPLAGELGIQVCGGRGKHARQTPQELVAIGDRVGIDGAALARASRLVAKVDSCCMISEKPSILQQPTRRPSPPASLGRARPIAQRTAGPTWHRELFEVLRLPDDDAILA